MNNLNTNIGEHIKSLDFEQLERFKQCIKDSIHQKFNKIESKYSYIEDIHLRNHYIFEDSSKYVDYLEGLSKLINNRFKEIQEV